MGGEDRQPTRHPLGHGDPAWLAAYDNVAGHFGLYDDLADVRDGPVAYLVCGWYAMPVAHDPIAGGTESAFWERLEELAWRLDPELLGDGPVPSSCLFHGSAVAIGWPTPLWRGGGKLGTEEDARPAAGEVVVAIGDTVAAALAALARQEAGPLTGHNAETAQRLIEAGLTGRAAVLAKPDGTARLDAAMHAARFGHAPGRPVSEVVWQPLPPGRPEPPDGTPPGPFDPIGPLPLRGRLARVKRPGPRAWHPHDPAVVLQGAGRGFRHGGDGRFTSTGHLRCRTTGHTVVAVGVPVISIGAGAEVLPADPLAGLQLPVECRALLVELAAVDPGSAPDLGDEIGGGGPRGPSVVAAARAQLWRLRIPGVNPRAALDGCTVLGALPSPLAITPPGRPWCPYRLDWSLGYLPSPRGVHDWNLGELDFSPLGRPPNAGQEPAVPMVGSTVLTAHAATLAERADRAEPGSPEESLDVMSTVLADLGTRLRRDPLDPVVQPLGSEHTAPPPGPRPPGFLPFRAGWLRLQRLRVVDGFGRYLDLLPGPSAIVRSPGVDVPPEPLLLRFLPRFTSPARAALRLTDGTGGQLDAVEGISPVAGYLLASPLDGTVEFFDVDGTGLGRLRTDSTDGTTVWEVEPGTAATVGGSPSASIANPVLAAIAEQVLAADRAIAALPVHRRPLPALESLRRVLDVTRMTVDEIGAAGEEHLGLMLGHPVVVIRARVDIEVEDPRRPPELASLGLPARLGVLGHLQDGLLGYFAGEDHGRLLVVDPAVADLAGSTEGAPPLPGYVDPRARFQVQPGSPVMLTLLMVPGSQVHLTTGLLPRKSIALQREWTANALPRISPTTRHGPVLRDPTATRLPVPGRVRGTWQWHRRPDPWTWASDEVVPATGEALLPTGRLEASDGWLRLLRGSDPAYDPDYEPSSPLEVSCVRTAWMDGEQVVLAVGVDNVDGSHVMVPVAQAAGLLEQRQLTLRTRRAGQPQVPVRPLRRADGRRTLRAAQPGGLDELLELPRC